MDDDMERSRAIIEECNEIERGGEIEGEESTRMQKGMQSHLSHLREQLPRETHYG